MVIEMSDKEVLRSQVMAQLVEGKLDQESAAQRLKISTRQVKRLKQRYLEGGAKGLVSRKRGVPSNRRTPAAEMAQAMQLVGAHYADFGPTLACEKLRERHGLSLSVETVRKAMTAAGYWRPRRGQAMCPHPMRERRPRRGELIQVDGSPHDWFEGRAPACCLLVFIDDATSELMGLRFVDTETTLGYMALLEQHIHHHGLPAAIYSDRHSIFRLTNPAAPSGAQTQFERALEQLGIEGIQANSPQAKGRVERANQTLQDRLVKEMRLLGMNDQVSANAWLPEFIADFNRRFAVKPADIRDAHVRYRGTQRAIRRILSVQQQRCLSKNLSCQFEKSLLQVRPHGLGLSLRGAKVTVHCHHDGSMELLWQDRALKFDTGLKPGRHEDAVDGKTVNARVDLAMKQRGRTIPPQSHPYKMHAPRLLDPRAGIVALFEQPRDNMLLESLAP